MRFTDKVCLVTGGGSGIGRAACQRLAAEGGKVLVIDVNREGAEETVARIRLTGGTAETAVADVGNPEQVKAAVDRAEQLWGKVDVLVNNAAMMTFTDVVNTTVEAWDKLMAINLRGPFLFCKYAIPLMPEHGAIVNVSSVHAHETEQDVSPYAASKGGMEAFTRVLALELESRKIRANCVAPGAVNTPMLWNNPNVKSGAEKIQGAVGEPEDLAAAIAFLASEEARFITGTVLVVDGGRLDILQENTVSRPLAQFMFATGIENSYPMITLPDGKRMRVDEMEKCGHYQNWRVDFQLVKECGIEFLRYGPAYYKTHLGPGKYDWDFVDETFNELRHLKIEPIVDLCHFGVPDWIGSAQNPDFPRLFAEYARAFAERYRHLRLYTPINEIYVAAKFSAHYGWWNECEHSDKAFVTAIHHLCKANMLAMRAILQVTPSAIFIQSESSEYFHAEEPSSLKRAFCLNEERFLSLDLTYGMDLDVTMYEYLLDNGMKREEYHWFRENHVKKNCIMGNDYYITNEHLVKPDGSTEPAGEIYGYYVITRQYFERYQLPVMHTETNLADAERAPAWLKKEWANMLRLKSDGVPILGFTWYSLTDQVDWDTALRENNGRVNPLGLYDLDRKIRPVGEAYQRLIKMWRGIMPTSSFGLRLNI